MARPDRAGLMQARMGRGCGEGREGCGARLRARGRGVARGQCGTVRACRCLFALAPLQPAVLQWQCQLGGELRLGAWPCMDMRAGRAQHRMYILLQVLSPRVPVTRHVNGSTQDYDVVVQHYSERSKKCQVRNGSCPQKLASVRLALSPRRPARRSRAAGHLWRPSLRRHTLKLTQCPQNTTFIIPCTVVAGVGVGVAV